MSVRDAIAEAGFEALARADFGAGAAYYRARRLAPPGDEVLLRLVVGREPRAEAAAARLDHGNVLRCDGASHAPGFHALVFEPFRARSLARELERRGRIEARRVAEIGVRVARALGHAHAAGVVHGSLCAENVALGADGVVKLVGFGIAGLPIDPTADGDLVDLGATLLRALTGGDPRGGLAAGAGADEDAVPLARILERCMRLRPELGFYPDARAVEIALESAARRLGEPRADMTGRFAAEELAGLLQMLELTRRSGRLELAATDGAGGAVAFQEGKIVAARAGSETGREAVQRLLGLPAGRFRLWYGRAPSTGEPPAGAQGISEALLESLRRRDETARLDPRLPHTL